MSHRSLDTYIALMPEEQAVFFRKAFNRRTLFGAGLGAAATAAGLARFGTTALAQTPVATLDLSNAAPPEQQVLRFASDPAGAKALDFYEQVYGRPAIADLWSDPLVRLNKNFEIVPGAALTWEVSEDGLTTTFQLDEGLMWSDGNPVTAADYVKTFQYAADPAHAWDFAWFWSDGTIANYVECLAGEVPLDQLGVAVGANEFEFVVTSTVPAPYMPAKMLYSLPLSKAALESTGPLYNNDPATAVSAGPFILGEWLRDQSITYIRNETYTGKQVIPLQKIVVKMAAAGTGFTLYDAGEIDYIEGISPAELQIMEQDRSNELYQGVGDFGCFYFFFDVTVAPWDNKLVRQAFSHVVDRDAMQQQIWSRQAKPAFSFLSPGFPAANEEALKGIQNFDPELAKSLLAEAGYPDGEGFGKQIMYIRGGGSTVETATTQAYAAMVKEHLNIDIELQTVDRAIFYDQLNAKPTKVPFGWISYGMDYFDASNMLGVWLSGGRHSWVNADYDAKVKEAAAFTGSTEERTAMFQEAEQILVEDVPAVFTYFATPIQCIKPYVAGPALEPDNNGIAAVHWPGFSTTQTVLEELYITADAPADRS